MLALKYFIHVYVCLCCVCVCMGVYGCVCVLEPIPSHLVTFAKRHRCGKRTSFPEAREKKSKHLVLATLVTPVTHGKTRNTCASLENKFSHSSHTLTLTLTLFLSLQLPGLLKLKFQRHGNGSQKGASPRDPSKTCAVGRTKLQ